jgi:hypothetical protein
MAGLHLRTPKRAGGVRVAGYSKGTDGGGNDVILPESGLKLKGRPVIPTNKNHPTATDGSATSPVNYPSSAKKVSGARVLTAVTVLTCMYQLAAASTINGAATPKVYYGALVYRAFQVV